MADNGIKVEVGWVSADFGDVRVEWRADRVERRFRYFVKRLKRRAGDAAVIGTAVLDCAAMTMGDEAAAVGNERFKWEPEKGDADARDAKAYLVEAFRRCSGG